MASNGDIADLLERVSISSWSRSIAEHIDLDLPHEIDAECIASIFSATPRLDFRATFVRTIYQECLDHLTTRNGLSVDEYARSKEAPETTAKHRRSSTCQRAGRQMDQLHIRCSVTIRPTTNRCPGENAQVP